ncbi:GNAT family N-acetyltransferase [Cohaesibacter celericrescens]|nr:GNAT family N-acetyltransferase [Cohaesibacter celericrescens]
MSNTVEKMQSSSFTPPTLRSMQTEDADAVLRIYQEGIDTENATFTAKASEWSDWNQSHLPNCRIVATIDSIVVGWAALSGVSSRCVYDGVAEVSIYVSPSVLGKGIGSMLMKALVKESEESGIWMLQASIFPENEGSIALHRKFGFRIVGMRKKIARMNYGKMNGTWRDVAFVERRSSIVGLD